MPGQEKSRFELRNSVPWSFDPQLQEVIRAQETGSAINPAIVSRPGVADVIVRLKDEAKDKIPAALQKANLQKPRRIGGEKSAIVTGEINVAEIKSTRKEVASLKAATKLYLHLHNSIPTTHCDSGALDEAARDDKGRTFPGLNGTDVIVGVVDFGCDFAHKNFIQPWGTTRLLYLWDQSDTPQPDNSLPYGREFNSAKINEALKTNDPYDYLKYTPPIAAHGTHVMDIAAGNGRESNLIGGIEGPGFASNPMSHPGVAPNAFLIFVHLKANGNEFLGNSRHLLDAVAYIFDKADQLGMPAVVNLSLSTSGGPHDGSTLVEQGFEELLKQPGRAIVASAGNAYGQKGHASGTIAGGEKKTLTWYTDPGAWKNEIEVWYPGSFKNLTVSLVPPDDTPLEAIPLGQAKDLYDQKGVRRGRISHRAEDPNNGDNQINIRVPLLDQTQSPWQVVLSNNGATPVTFHAWIGQDERGNAHFDEPTDSAFTLGSICCGKSTLTVGAFDTSEMAYLAPPYAATAAGPTRPNGNGRYPSLPKPELSAPGNNIVAARAYGGTTVMSGTSMAAAHVTGLVALLFERAKRAGQAPLSIDTTRQILMAEAEGLAAPSQQDVPRLGSRRIDGAGALSKFSVPAPPPPAPDPSPRGDATLASTDVSTNDESPNDLLKKLIDQLKDSKFKLIIGNDGEVSTIKLRELVSMLGQISFELVVEPPH